MLPPRCRNPPWRNIEVISVNQGQEMPNRLAVPAWSKRFFGTKPSAKTSSSSPLSLKESCQKKTAMQPAMIAQVTIGFDSPGFSSEIGIIACLGRFARSTPSRQVFQYGASFLWPDPRRKYLRGPARLEQKPASKDEERSAATRIAELTIIDPSNMIASSFQAGSFFIEVGKIRCFHGTVEIVACFFITVLGTVQTRLIHGVVGSFGKRL